ncbi:hypothetical protein SAMN05421678_10847 [Actinopolymorpha cephalotaxi]|uniref:Uncharacterized protein n=1 Tax=Actinopolymorpha cephalotaxi TaxID=504797 RepID=A0A1I2U6T0_9ACTN|nr:hypothetical protein SAMN05421678_10847 [Actinopolymorpha cephalotaxi]
MWPRSPPVTCSGSATSTGPNRKLNAQVSTSRPSSRGRPRRNRSPDVEPPAPADSAVRAPRASPRTSRWTDHTTNPSRANDNPSAPITQPGPATAAPTPATAGPTTIASELVEPASELPASRWSGGSSSASRVYFPAEPQACSSEESPSRTTSPTGCRTPNAQVSATADRQAARSTESASSRRAAGSRRSHRPKTRAPTTPGRAYAATDAPTSIPARPGAAIPMASRGTATTLIPSPRSLTPNAPSRRRSLGSASRGRYAESKDTVPSLGPQPWFSSSRPRLLLRLSHPI